MRKFTWNRKWWPPPVFLPGKFHWQRSLVGCTPWGHKEWTWLSDWACKACTFKEGPHPQMYREWLWMEHLGAVGKVAEKLCHASPGLCSSFRGDLDSITCFWKILWLLAQDRLTAYKCLNQGTQTLKVYRSSPTGKRSHEDSIYRFSADETSYMV